jgi:cytidylate kinase
MKYKALTIAREYGSGGGEIASIVASNLGWRLVDKVLLAEIGRRERLPVGDPAAIDERVDPWLHRTAHPLREKGAAFAPVGPFDADAAAALAKQAVQEAYSAGNCVIVGRGSQCFLQAKPDVFHAFVYARWWDRVHRVRTKVPRGADMNRLLHTMDGERLAYVFRYYGENRLDTHLYDLMINSHNQSEAAARLILLAMDAVA